MSQPVTLGARVLFVDDEEAIRRLFETFLKSEGFDFVGASSVEEALGVLKAEGAEVVIVDKNLPDGSGIEILHSCRESHPDVEVIFLTGYPSLESAIDALRLGAFDYIIKPVLDLELVSEKVRRALERRHLRIQGRRLAQQLADAIEGVFESLTAARAALEKKSLEELSRHLEAATAATRRARESQQRLGGDEAP